MALKKPLAMTNKRALKEHILQFTIMATSQKWQSATEKHLLKSNQDVLNYIFPYFMMEVVTSVLVVPQADQLAN